MADYRIQIMRGGSPLQGVEVIAGDVLYAAATGVDGMAVEPTGGRADPVRVACELIGASFAVGTIVTLRPDLTTEIEV